MFYWELSKRMVCFTDNAICINEVLYSWRKENRKLVDGNHAWKLSSNPLSQIFASSFLWLSCTSGICFGNMYVWIERLFSTGMIIFYELRRKQSTERMSVVWSTKLYRAMWMLFSLWITLSYWKKKCCQKELKSIMVIMLVSQAISRAVVGYRVETCWNRYEITPL